MVSEDVTDYKVLGDIAMICFAWGGFPQYAARLVGAFVEAVESGSVEPFRGEKIVVAAKRPEVPVKGMENYTKCEIKWVGPNDKVLLKDLFGVVLKMLVVSGWSYDSFNRFRDEVLSTGGIVIASCDNNFRIMPTFLGRLIDWRRWNLWGVELLKKLRFRLCFKPKYSGYLVPGESGVRLMEYYGISRDRIELGLYAADSALFSSQNNILDRPKRFLYVGQYIERKNVRRLCKAFMTADNDIKGGWSLCLYGCGPLKTEIELMARDSGGRIEVNDFVQPEQLPQLYRSARFFCLPSLNEHWGLVVHEAALSGCLLLLSRTVGASEDLLGRENGIMFNPKSLKDMVDAFRRAMLLSDCELEVGHVESKRLAHRIGFESFVSGVTNLITRANTK